MSLSNELTVLLLLISGVSAVSVSPPSNVRVSCQNLKVSVRWDYRTKEPQTIFKGTLHPWNCTFENKDHEYDLSNCIWKSGEERYLSFMYVSIAAVQGGIKSEAEKSKTFSFDSLKTVNTKCSLEFPPVEIEAKEQMPTVSFQNPLKFYNLAQKVTDEYKIGFTVKNEQGAFPASCTDEKICQCNNVSFKEGVKKCVNVSGTLLVRIGAQQVKFKETEKCTIRASTVPPPQPGFSEVILAAVLSSLLLFVLIVVTACICKLKAWTFNPSDTLPSSLKDSAGNQNKHPPNPTRPQISRISVESLDSCQNDPEETVLLKDTGQSADNSSAGSDYNPSNSCYAERPHLDSSDSDRSGTDDDSGDDSVKTECVSIEERSAYDCPHVMMDMGDGDMVTGYTGN
ncbi:interferon gamma receptor 1 [Pelmatolapia mariae]|uniref:interferon gamma receptor 1 n=1 Tax=Pelmatolapia mariae TaxID=158779 RepID=UPI002FE5E2D0